LSIFFAFFFFLAFLHFYVAFFAASSSSLTFSSLESEFESESDAVIRALDIGLCMAWSLPGEVTLLGCLELSLS
jgi:hypothetical protein